MTNSGYVIDNVNWEGLVVGAHVTSSKLSYLPYILSNILGGGPWPRAPSRAWAPSSRGIKGLRLSPHLAPSTYCLHEATRGCRSRRGHHRHRVKNNESYKCGWERG